jgi:hypothetical protein
VVFLQDKRVWAVASLIKSKNCPSFLLKSRKECDPAMVKFLFILSEFISVGLYATVVIAFKLLGVCVGLIWKIISYACGGKEERV